MDDSSVSTGIKWALKACLKSFQVPKSGGDCFMASCWRSRAHSPAGVPSLKWERAAAIFRLALEYSALLR